MSSSYYLPCACGKKLVVDSRAAGETLLCECGAKVEAPTLRGLAALERVNVSAPTPRREWGAAQGITFLALVIAAASLGAGGFLYQKVRQSDLQSMPLGETHGVWEELTRLARGLPESRAAIAARTRNEMLERWMYVLLAVGGVAVVTAAAGAVASMGGKHPASGQSRPGATSGGHGAGA